VFGQWLCDMATHDPRLVAITPAMREGSGMVEFHKKHPSRYFDVGIAEQHAITFAGGLACEGMKPVVAIYSTFLQRGYDQMIHDVAMQNLPVVFALDRAGIVGADGATHMGAFDIAFVRCIPNMSMIAPADESRVPSGPDRRLRAEPPGVPCAIPRGAGAGVPVDATDLQAAALGQGRGASPALGHAAGGRQARGHPGVWHACCTPRLQAGEALDATVVNMRFVKPLDTELLLEDGRQPRRCW
jgi:1-deoxy-D-xylulose-5-phosphate synthase